MKVFENKKYRFSVPCKIEKINDMFSEFIENLIYSLDIDRLLEESIAGAIPIYTFDILLSFDPLLKEYYNEAIRDNSDLKEMRIEGIINIGSEYFYREAFYKNKKTLMFNYYQNICFNEFVKYKGFKSLKQDEVILPDSISEEITNMIEDFALLSSVNDKVYTDGVIDHFNNIMSEQYEK